MSHMLEDRKKMRMTRSWSDYLLCQLAADKKLSTLESLPAEILEPILEEINRNSISGVRALACASRTCRALASPYFFKPLHCEFRELIGNDILKDPPVVTLSTADNFKTLKFHREPQPGRDRLQTVTQVLNVEHTYECVEYLPDRLSCHFSISAPALDLLSRTLPLLSRLVLDLDVFIGYSSSWDQAYRKATAKITRYSYAPSSYVDGLDVVCAIARFENLRHLTLHYKLQQDQVALMHPATGCQAVHELFDSIQKRKRGQALIRLDVVFYTTLMAMFGCVNDAWHADPPKVSTSMTVANNESSSQGGKEPRYTCTCDNPLYGTVIERRRRVERLYGKHAWTYRFGSVQWNLLHGKYSHFPWHVMIDSVIWLALFPSNFIFDEGKRVRYKASLADPKLILS